MSTPKPVPTSEGPVYEENGYRCWLLPKESDSRTIVKIRSLDFPRQIPPEDTIKRIMDFFGLNGEYRIRFAYPIEIQDMGYTSELQVQGTQKSKKSLRISPLTPSQASCISLRADGESCKIIAAKEHCTPPTVKSRIIKAYVQILLYGLEMVWPKEVELRHSEEQLLSVLGGDDMLRYAICSLKDRQSFPPMRFDMLRQPEWYLNRRNLPNL